MISLTAIETGFDFPYNITEVWFDYIAEDVPPCIFFEEEQSNVFVCSLPIEHDFFRGKEVQKALIEKHTPFNGLPKTHLQNHLEVMWIGFEGDTVNNIQINGHWKPYLSRSEQRRMYRLLIDTFCQEGFKIPTVETMRQRAKELNTTIMEAPYASSVYDGPRTTQNGREFKVYNQS